MSRRPIPRSVAWFSRPGQRRERLPGRLPSPAIERSWRHALQEAPASASSTYSQDYRLLNELAVTLFETGPPTSSTLPIVPEVGKRNRICAKLPTGTGRTLGFDPENARAHYGLAQVWARLGDAELARRITGNCTAPTGVG